MSTTEGAKPSTAVLEVRGLSVAYKRAGLLVPATIGVDLRVEARETLAIVGESGSGKSTVAQAVMGLLPGNGLLTDGSVHLAGQRIDNLPDRLMRRLRGKTVGFVPQDPTTSLNPTHRIGRQVAEPMTIHGDRTRGEARQHAANLLKATGIDPTPERLRQLPHQFSGGMRQRVLIAAGLACDPMLVIADEPTSALDVTVARQVLDRFDELADRNGTAVLLITHDLGVAADRADRIVVMRQGRIVEEGDPSQVLNHPRHEYTQQLIEAAPGLRTDRRLYATSQPTAIETTSAPEPVLALHGIRKRFATAGGAPIQAVDDVSFTVGRGRTLGVVGESGSGKSTTARIAMRLEEPDSGTVTFEGADITQTRGRELRTLRRRFQMVQQNPYSSLDPLMSIADIVTEPLRVFEGRRNRDHRSRAIDLLEEVGLSSRLAERRPSELSGGQRQRVAIARALAPEPSLIVCDEPVSALDVIAQHQVLQVLAELQEKRGLSYLFISHDLAVIRQIAHEVVVMRAGRAVESGASHEVFDHPQHEYTQELVLSVPGGRRRSLPHSITHEGR